MAAELVSCRRSAFVLYVRYCFLLLRSAVHFFSEVGSQLELHRINFLALNAVLFDCCMHYPQFFFWKWRQCRLVCCFLLGFERAHCTVKPTRAHLSLASLPWLFFLLGLGGSRENLNEDADFVPIGERKWLGIEMGSEATYLLLFVLAPPWVGANSCSSLSRLYFVLNLYVLCEMLQH